MGTKMSNLKRLATSLHLWFGLTFGMVGCYLAATGGWLILRPQAEMLSGAYPSNHSHCATPASFAQVLSGARRVYPGSAVDSLWWRSAPDASVMVRFRDEQQAYFDRCSGTLLGVQSRWAGTFGFVEKLHRMRFLPADVAGNVAGIFAIAMTFVMAILGLYIWWPRRRSAWKPAIAFDRQLRGRARSRNRHSVVGAFAALGLILVAGTGIVIAYDNVQAWLMAVTGSRPIPKVKVARIAADKPVAMDAAWRTTLAQIPDVPLSATLKVPTAKQHAIEIYFNRAGDVHREVRNYLFADPTTGAVIRYTPYEQLPLGTRLYQWILALHQGKAGGLAGQLLTLALMLATLYLGYSGVKSFTQKRARSPSMRMRIAGIDLVADQVKSFHLVPADRRRLPRFAAGDHLEVQVPGGPKRHYSLVNGPDQRDSYTIAVRLEPSSRGGSRAMHKLSVGDEMIINGPRSHFAVARGGRHVTLVAAGIGITPMLSIARHRSARRGSFELHYFGRSAEGMAYRDLLARPPFADHVHLHIGLDRAAIGAELRSIVARETRRGHLYVCGPEGFMDTVTEAALAAGWPEKTIHREAFAPVIHANEPRAAIELKLARSGKTLTVSPDETVLEALLTAGIPMSSSCEQGTCGECALKVCAGEIEHRDRFLSEKARARGDIMLPCVSRARGNSLVVEL